MTAAFAAFTGRPVVIGAGVAGLMTALALAPLPVVLVGRAPLGAETSSILAQGGLAAAVGGDDDPAQHLADTLAAGDGLVDHGVAMRILAAAPEAIDLLGRLGARFDRDAGGALRLGLEAAHRRRRIVHADGDGTGRELVRALIERVRQTPSIAVLEDVEARRLLVDDGSVAGVEIAQAGSSASAGAIATQRVVIATGGIGGLFMQSTNPPGSFGQGLALAARAGAQLVDLEFVQFHPTALDVPARPMALVSEAVRGEGAVLVDERGERFLADLPGAELAPRDAVTRAVWRHMQAGHRVFLDARQSLGADFARRFPLIDAACKAAGIDAATHLIPVRPAAHYHMGGIAVDGEGRSSLAGLWACGEAAATGLHGANRLASNSLIEAVITARWVADSIRAAPARRSNAARLRLPSGTGPSDPAAVRAIVSRGLGISRDAPGLQHAIEALLPVARAPGPASDPAKVGLMLASAALRRRESRGAHFRTDFPQHDPTARRLTLCLDDAFAVANELASLPTAVGA